MTAANLPGAPLPAVEVLSPSTRLFDLHRNRDLLEQAGWPPYWVVALDGLELTAFEVGPDGYVAAAVASATQSWTAERPYPVTIRPADLLDD